MKADRDRPVVAIRADATQAIGGGHVMRCLTLAGELRAVYGPDVRVLFLGRAMPASLRERITAGGHEYLLLDDLAGGDSPRAAEEILALLTEQAVSRLDVLVVDHYGLSAAWMGAMRSAASRIIVIDELADRDFDCDAIVAPSLGVETLESAYRKRAGGADRCGLYLGTRYSLVAPAFRAKREAALIRRAESWPLSRILVSTGYSDVGGAAVTATEVLADTSWQVRVAIGSGSPSMARLEELARTASNVTLLPDCNDMAKQMLEADLMIGAPGTTSWERATLALPSLLVVSADNQRAIAGALNEIGAARILGEAGDLKGENLMREIARISGDRSIYKAMSAAAGRLCDGGGAGRVAAIVMETVA